MLRYLNLFLIYTVIWAFCLVQIFLFLADEVSLHAIQIRITLDSLLSYRNVIANYENDHGSYL
jgi:hypothetical protein